MSSGCCSQNEAEADVNRNTKAVFSNGTECPETVECTEVLVQTPTSDSDGHSPPLSNRSSPLPAVIDAIQTSNEKEELIAESPPPDKAPSPDASLQMRQTPPDGDSISRQQAQWYPLPHSASSTSLSSDLTDDIAASHYDGDDCSEVIDLQEHHLSSPIMSVSSQNLRPPNGVITHPSTTTVLTQLKTENYNLKKELSSLNKEVSKLEKENPSEAYEVQIATLETTIKKQQRDMADMKDQTVHQEEMNRKHLQHVTEDFQFRLEKVSRMYEKANKDKESMVVKFAMGEKELIIAKRDKENVERRLVEMNKDRNILMGKIKALGDERTKMCHNFEKRNSEANTFKREFDKAKDEINSRDVKIKWTQNKLKQETESHRETQEKLAQLTKEMKHLKEERDQIWRDCQDMIKKYQESEEIKSNTLDIQLKEQQALLLIEQEEKASKEELCAQHQKDLTVFRQRIREITDENNSLTLKVQSLERDRLDYERNLGQLKEKIGSLQQQLVDCQSQLATMDDLKMQLGRERERVNASQQEVERLRESNVELQGDMASCREKEAEMLQFTQRLAEKNVILQSEFNTQEARKEALITEEAHLRTQVEELEQEVDSLKESLSREKTQREEENQLLTKRLAEKTKHLDAVNVKHDDLQNHCAVLKRRNTSSMKELAREVRRLKTRLDSYETNSNDGGTMGSRCSSHSSLHNSDSTPFHASNNPSIPPLDSTQQLFVDKIVRLQSRLAMRKEKMDMLEETRQQLVREVQKKTRIIQNLALRETPGSLTSDKRDTNKAELAKHGGIMASLYGSKISDENMTLELSLEINKKLQAVLEDTLLKNILFKENVNTLGNEIEKLRREMRKQKGKP